MKLINAEIGLKGLGRELVNEGFGDVKVKIQGKEVLCVKSILIHGNKTFKKLLEDEKCGDNLELFEGCDVEAFLEIEKYYSGGTMEFTDDNKCIYYIKKHINDTMMMKLFKALHELNCNYLNDLKEMSENYIERNGYKYLKNDELLFQLKIEDLEWILSCKNLIIENDVWLLNQLIKWKNEMKNKNKKEENELKEEFIKLLKKYIHFEKININEISDENVNEMKEIISSNEINRNNYIMINVNEISNDKIKDIICKYYIEEDKTVIDMEDIEILKKYNIKETISILLNKEDIKLNEIGLLMIIDSKINYKIKNDIKSRILLNLLYKYKVNPSDRILKCLCLFVNDKKSIIIIEGLCGKEILFRILNFHYCLSEKTKKLLINYVNEVRLSKEEEDGLSQIIVDNDIIDRILAKEITSFSYPQSKCSFFINEEILFKPSFDGTYCEFSITPSLPDGIILDKENGVIYGKATHPTAFKKYEIICQNNKSEKKFSLYLLFRIFDMNASMTLFMTTITGKIIITYSNPDSTVEDLKKKIEETEAIPTDKQILIFAGNELKNDKKLSDYNITNNSSLFLALR